MIIPTQKAKGLLRRTNGNAQKTHCQNGHEFNEENTYISPKSQKRTCKICTSARVKERRQIEPEFKARNTENMRKWRAANKERDHKNWTDLRRRKKEWLDEQRSAGCIVCGETDPACIDFHHVDPSKKSANLSAAITSWSIERLQKEIVKTVLMCSNCHRRVEAVIRAGASPAEALKRFRQSKEG